MVHYKPPPPPPRYSRIFPDFWCYFYDLLKVLPVYGRVTFFIDAFRTPPRPPHPPHTIFISSSMLNMITHLPTTSKVLLSSLACIYIVNPHLISLGSYKRVFPPFNYLLCSRILPYEQVVWMIVSSWLETQVRLDHCPKQPKITYRENWSLLKCKKQVFCDSTRKSLPLSLLSERLAQDFRHSDLPKESTFLISNLDAW